MNIRSLVAILIALPLTIGHVQASPQGETINGTARVIDGDTISIRQQRIRIAAIDACEMDQTGILNSKVWPCGVVARSHLQKMIGGKHISCRVVDIDRYRRSVGQCFVENIDIGLAMVRTGHAEAMLRYLPRNHGIDVTQYGYAENLARENLLGIWRADVESPHQHRRTKSSWK